MKKLPIAVALLSLSIAAPVFACPMENHEPTPQTAEKAKDAPSKDKAAAKAADKTKEAKPVKAADKAKPADKVSQK